MERMPDDINHTLLNEQDDTDDEDDETVAAAVIARDMINGVIDAGLKTVK